MFLGWVVFAVSGREPPPPKGLLALARQGLVPNLKLVYYFPIIQGFASSSIGIKQSRSPR